MLGVVLLMMVVVVVDLELVGVDLVVHLEVVVMVMATMMVV